MKSISNNAITIAVKEHGAELASIICKGREYLWQAYEKYWKRHSPVLFPFVGALWHGEYRTKGTAYKMGQHGFARDMDFTLISETDTELWYRLASDEDTQAKYPYDFILEIGYKLIGNTVRVMWRVENNGDEILPFQIGAHPAFYWPMLDNAAIDAGVDAMEKELVTTDKRGYFRLDAKSSVLPISDITEGGCVGGVSEIKIEDGYLPLTIHSFDRDAIVIEDSLVSKVTLCDDELRPYVSLQFSSPLVGLWSPPKKRAPFVCIEPWYGRTDDVNYRGELADRKWMQSLKPGEKFEAHYDIIIEQ